MADFFTIENLMTLAMLVLLQVVLGFDNLLYISIESKRVPEQSQSFVRRLGIGVAIFLRIALLLILVTAIDYFKNPFFKVHWVGVFEGDFTLYSIIVLAGGAFIIYTAMKEIYHMLSVEDLGTHHDGGQKPVWSAIFWIVAMNLVFSFDSILSAIALSDNFLVIAAAIVVSGAMMIILADHVSEFLKRNRMYEVLGLFILFIVGVMLVSEGGHLAHLHLFTYIVEPMAKSTFYFVLTVLIVVDIVQSRYQKKLLAQKQAEIAGKSAAG